MMQSGIMLYDELKGLGFDLGEDYGPITFYVDYRGVSVSRIRLGEQRCCSKLYNQTGEAVTANEFVEALGKTMTLPALNTLSSITIKVAPDEIVSAELVVCIEAGTLNFLQGMKIDS